MPGKCPKGHDGPVCLACPGAKKCEERISLAIKRADMELFKRQMAGEHPDRWATKLQDYIDWERSSG